MSIAEDELHRGQANYAREIKTGGDFIDLEQLVQDESLNLSDFYPHIADEEDDVYIDELRTFVNQEAYAQGIRGKRIRFLHPESAGCDSTGIGIIAASLQGVKQPKHIFVSALGVPLPFDTLIYHNIRDYITHLGMIAREMPWASNKIEFYQHICRILNDAVRIDPFAAWQCCLEPNKGEFSYQKFSLFSALFPEVTRYLESSVSLDKNSALFTTTTEWFPELSTARHTLAADDNERTTVSALVSEILHENPIDKKFSLRELIKGVIRIAQLSRDKIDLQNPRLSIELAILTHQYDEVIETVAHHIALDTDTLTVPIDWLSKREEIRHVVARNKLTDVTESPQVIEKLLPEQFGLKSDLRKTKLMHEHYQESEAIVIDRESIINNPEKYLAYQRALVLAIAKAYGIDVTRDRMAIHTVPIPKLPSARTTELADKQRALFLTHERYFKEQSDWRWLLLYPQIQAKFLALMPYCEVPPFAQLNEDLIPLEHIAFPLTAISANTPHYDNALPFLNEVVSRRYTRDRIVRYSVEPAIPGEFIREILREGGLCFIDHAIARRTLSYWGLVEPLDATEFSVRFPQKAVEADVDMWVFGDLHADVGAIAHRVGTKLASVASRFVRGRASAAFWGGSMKGISMTAGIDYAIVVRPSVRRVHNAWTAAHSNKCQIQALRAWPGGETFSRTNLLIQGIPCISGMRSICLYPTPVSLPNGHQAFAIKAIDIAGGLIDYAEANGGVIIDGKRRSIVRFPRLVDAFPENTMLLWHVIRTVHDLLAHDGGVLFPEGLPDSHRDTPELTSSLTKIGASQFRGIVKRGKFLLSELLPKLQDIQLSDLRLEMQEGAKESIDVDPYNFLVLSSGPDVTNELRGLHGVELSVLFPHLHVLRSGPDLWQNILARVAMDDRKTGESGKAYLARSLLDIPKVRDVVTQAIEQEFFANPMRVGEKLLRSGGYTTKGRDARDWGSLHKKLFPYMIAPNSWQHFLTSLIPSPHTFTSIKELAEYLSSSHMYGQAAFKRIERAALMLRQVYPDSPYAQSLFRRQQEALIDWLTDIGF